MLIVATLIGTAAEFDLKGFVRHTLVSNPMIRVDHVTVTGTRELDGRPDWKAYLFDMNLSAGGKKQNVSEILFVNERGNLATTFLIDTNDGSNLRKTMREAPRNKSAETNRTAGSGAEGFDLEKFVRNTLLAKSRFKVEKVLPVSEISLEGHSGWKAHMFHIVLDNHGKKMKIPETLFVNLGEKLATVSLIDLKKRVDLRNTVQPPVDKSMYDKSHLVAGNPDAPHKVLIFSDPQCPVCIGYFPRLLKDVRAHPDKVALYYYHMPLLRLHPVSDTLTRAMEYLQQQGRVEEAMRLYDLRIDPRLSDERKILAEVKKQLKIDLTPEQIDRPEIRAALKKDMQKALSLMVRGTPTVYFDERYDPSRALYRKFLK